MSAANWFLTAWVLFGTTIFIISLRGARDRQSKRDFGTAVVFDAVASTGNLAFFVGALMLHLTICAWLAGAAGIGFGALAIVDRKLAIERQKHD